MPSSQNPKDFPAAESHATHRLLVDRAPMEALNWAMAMQQRATNENIEFRDLQVADTLLRKMYEPTQDWEIGGKILTSLIEDGFVLSQRDFNRGFKMVRVHEDEVILGMGSTPLMAAVRAHLKFKVGQQIDVPIDLKPSQTLRAKRKSLKQ